MIFILGKYLNRGANNDMNHFQLAMDDGSGVKNNLACCNKLQ